MSFLVSTLLITLAAYLWYAASLQPSVKFGGLAAFLRSKAKVVRMISLTLILISIIPVFISSGFAVAVFFVITILMTIWSCLLLFPPLIFKQDQKKPNARK